MRTSLNYWQCFSPHCRCKIRGWCFLQLVFVLLVRLCMIAFLSLGPAAGVARASAPRLPGSRDASPGVEADWPQCLPPLAAGCSAALPETSAVGDTDEWGSPGSQGQCTGGCTGFIRWQTKYHSCSAAASRRQIKLCEAIRLYQLSLPQSRLFLRPGYHLDRDICFVRLA